MKKINAYFYTRGKFGKDFRETVDTNNEYLYSRGHYPTKIKKEDLPEDYIRQFGDKEIDIFEFMINIMKKKKN